MKRKYENELEHGTKILIPEKPCCSNSGFEFNFIPMNEVLYCSYTEFKTRKARGNE